MLPITQKLYVGRKVSYVRCIKCSYNNVAKGIRLFDKKAFFVYAGNSMQVRAFERYIPLSRGTFSIFDKSWIMFIH